MPMSGNPSAFVPDDIMASRDLTRLRDWLVASALPFHARKATLFNVAAVWGLRVPYEIARDVLPETRDRHPHAERRFQ